MESEADNLMVYGRMNFEKNYFKEINDSGEEFERQTKLEGSDFDDIFSSFTRLLKTSSSEHWLLYLRAITFFRFAKIFEFKG